MISPASFNTLLESEEVAAAVLSGVNQTVEIAAVEWAEEQRLLVPWTILRGRDDGVRPHRNPSPLPLPTAS